VPKRFPHHPARRPGRSRDSSARSPRDGILHAILIIAAGLVAFANSFSGVFVFDDEPAIVENPNIRRLWPLAGAIQSPPGTTASGRPLVSLTLALNYALAPADAREALREPPRGAPADEVDRFRRNLWGYHALNLLVHLIAALTLYGVLRRTLGAPTIPPRIRERADGLALAMALIWVVHPLTTGAVTYIIQRAESLMGLCLLLTLYCSIRAWTGPAWWTAAAVVACALGMASKESMVVAPLVVMISDLVFTDHRRSWLAVVRRRWPLYLGLIATWGILATLLAAGNRPHAVGLGFTEWPWWRYLAAQAGVLTHYLRLVVVPAPLVLDYDWPPPSGVWAVILPGLLITTLVAASAVMLIRRQLVGFAGACFFLLLAPTSSVLPIVTEVAAEHRMYLPLAAAVAVGVIGACSLFDRLHLSRRAGSAVAGLVVAVFGLLTLARNRDYESAERIWLDTVEKRPANARARQNYATVLLERGHYHEAERHLRTAVDLRPQFAEAHAALGVALCAQQRLDDGIEHLRRAIAISPRFAAAHQSLGEAYASEGMMAPAVEHYGHALSQKPQDPTLLNRLAWILATDPDDGVRDGERALRLAERAVVSTDRQDAVSLDTLAAAQAETGRFSDAVATAEQAMARARSTGALEYLPELEARLMRYRQNQPFRQKRVR
jgi:protein O-mannosyl-transferase